LDITLLGEHHIKHNLREVYEICHYFLGVDPVKEWVPVRPAQHYTMGGVRDQLHRRESDAQRIVFRREAACWDMHGFNRLGGNSVAETVAAGMIVGEFIADFCERSENSANIPTRLVEETLRREQAKIDVLIDGAGTESATVLMAGMQNIMTGKVGIFRTGKVLEEAVHELQQLLLRRSQHRPARQGAERQPGVSDRLPGAKDAQDGALRRLRRAPADREPRRSLPRGLPAAQRRPVAEPYPGKLEVRERYSTPRSRTNKSMS
jgi:fumarate reductase flavoprotein subunit